MTRGFPIRYTKRWRRDGEGWIETELWGRFYRDYALNKTGQFGRCIEGVWHWS